MDATARQSLQDWLRQILRESPSLFEGNHLLVEASSGGRRVIPPDQLPYLRKLIWAILDGRDIVAAYNYALLALFAVFTLVHWLEKRQYRKRWLARTSQEERTVLVSDESATTNHHHGSSKGSSSSSSVSSGMRTPSGALKDSVTDLERLPLLSTRERRPAAAARSSTLLWRKLKCWMEHQPPPLPIVHRVLPSNGTSFFVLLWLALNVFVHLYQLPLEPKYFFCFADRAGYVFIVNLPLLYLLAAKNQPLAVLTGRSYEALNIFHRRVGEWVCLEALLHTLCNLVWEFALQPEWLRGQGGAWAYLTHPLILLGIGAFVSYELLFFTSLGSFRQRWYELFLASHVVLQILALAFLYLHFFTARPYVLTALAIFVVDRVLWRLALKSATFTAETHVLPDGETIFMSIEWDMPGHRRSRWSLWPRKSIRHGWEPTDHVFLTVPVLGRTHALQAHPFTIASAAPEHAAVASQTAPIHHPPRPGPAAKATLDLLIRAQDGFTADLLCYAHRHRHIPVRLDGPYGSSHALDMLRAADHALLVAGGSGIAVTFPLAWALLCDGDNRATREPDDGDDDDDVGVTDNTKQGQEDDDHGSSRGSRMRVSGRRTVRMLWVIHSDEHRFWMPQARLDQLVAAGLDLVVPPPTSEAGRPDVEGLVQGWIEGASVETFHDGDVAMVVSGPDGLNRMVRNTCARAISRGANIRLAVEKFGW